MADFKTSSLYTSLSVDQKLAVDLLITKQIEANAENNDGFFLAYDAEITYTVPAAEQGVRSIDLPTSLQYTLAGCRQVETTAFVYFRVSDNKEIKRTVNTPSFNDVVPDVDPEAPKWLIYG